MPKLEDHSELWALEDDITRCEWCGGHPPLTETVEFSPAHGGWLHVWRMHWAGERWTLAQVTQTPEPPRETACKQFRIIVQGGPK